MRICPQCNRQLTDDVLVCPNDGTPTFSVEQQLEELVGTVLDGRWKLQRLLGRGGMGAVYKAEQLSIQRSVALKVIKTPLVPDARLVARFMREGRVLSTVRHPNIVRLIDFGQEKENGVLFMVMELVPGKSLHAILERRGTFTLIQLMKLGEQLMSALAEAHEHGVVHRDLKPRNIMLEIASGVGIHLTLLDFGVAHVELSAHEQLTRTGALQGTPRYMAPEQVQGGPISARTDLYAAGILLYRLLSGQEPIQAGNLFEMMVKQVKELPPPLEERWGLLEPVHMPMVHMVHQMLAKDPEARPESALVVLKQLRLFRQQLEALKSGIAGSAVRMDGASVSNAPHLEPEPTLEKPLPQAFVLPASHTSPTQGLSDSPPSKASSTPNSRPAPSATSRPIARARPPRQVMESTTRRVEVATPSRGFFHNMHLKEVVVGAVLVILIVGGLGLGLAFMLMDTREGGDASGAASIPADSLADDSSPSSTKSGKSTSNKAPKPSKRGRVRP